MNAPVYVAPPIELGSVAEELNINVPFIKRIVRTIVWHGHAESLVGFVRHEESLVAEMRARRAGR